MMVFDDRPHRDDHVPYVDATAHVPPLQRYVKLGDLLRDLRGRSGGLGGGFTCADDVADYIERKWGGD